MSLKLIFNTGRNNRLLYYIKAICRQAVPSKYLRILLPRLLAQARNRADYDYILDRVDYYNRMSEVVSLPQDAKSLSEHSLRASVNSVYYYDSLEHSRFFEPQLKWAYVFGDLTTVPEVPSFVKARPIKGDNTNSVLLKLNKIRHYIFVKDRKPFRKKIDKLVFRGDIGQKTNRRRFVDMFSDNPMFNVADTPCDHSNKAQEMTLYEQLEYKFIASLEGIDVATNLKWIMSSNSVAVMPRPRYETWFMEGRLIPDYHYIEVKDDFSDVEQKIRYYIDHPEKAEAIVRNANAWVNQFRDLQREHLISLLVFEKYFEKTAQK